MTPLPKSVKRALNTTPRLKRLVQRVRASALRRFGKARIRPLNEVHAFWRQPAPEGNDPSVFAERSARSDALVTLIRRETDSSARLLEVGCNVGRNLAYLRRAGFKNLEGIEINPHAVELLRERHPELSDVVVHVGAAEDLLARYPDDEFDLVFTMAVIEHIHPDSSVVFDNMARIARRILAIEPFGYSSPRHYPHDVRKLFTDRGFRLVRATPMSDLVPPILGEASMREYVAWEFARRG